MRAKDKISYRSGSHILLDCLKCSRDKLENSSFIFNLLNDFPDKIEMSKMRSPYVFKYHGQKHSDCGLTGIVLIDEGHLAIHAFPEKKQVFVDIFSCLAFDTNIVINEMINAFEAKDHKVEMTCQGAEFPHHIKLAGNLKMEERNKVLTHL